ncbi:MAG: hypothetical protein PHQ46_07920 [Negativicutes bacterium]|nr:hypothetical protein [Negativicutes bacterium]
MAGWERTDLAKKARLSSVTVRYVENETNSAKKETIEKIVEAFSDIGIEFTENDGVRRRPEGIEVFEGAKRFDDFYEFIYEYLKRYGGAVCIGSSDARLYAKYRSDPELHRSRMRDLVKRGDVSFRIIAEEGDYQLTASSYSKYKWLPKELFAPTSFYAFGECLALVSFVHEPSPYVVLIKSGPFAEAYRQAFYIAWEKGQDPPPSALK